MAKLMKDFVRIENNFTIIPNEILRNKEMKSSTKNILLTMFGLPSDWDFSISGITTCVYESYETVQKSLVELEKMGYITRKRQRRDNGTLGAMIYTIHQFPVSEDKNTYKKNFSNQDVKKPKQVKSNTGKNQHREEPIQDSKRQISKDNKSNTDSKYKTDDKESMDKLNNNSTPSPKEKEKEKENNSPKGSTYNSHSGGNEVDEKPSKNLSESDLDNLVNQMPLRARKLCYHMTADKDLSANVGECIEYFLDKHKEHTGGRHNILTDETLQKIVKTITNETEVDRGEYSSTYAPLVTNDLEDKSYKRIIDIYFKTRFRQKIDYSIAHFTSDRILTNMMNRDDELWYF